MMQFTTQPCSTVMVSRLEKDNPVGQHLIHQAIDFIDPPRPHVPAKLFQMLRLSDPAEWLAHHRVHEVDNPKCGLSIGVDPIMEIVAKLARQDCDPCDSAVLTVF